MLVLVLVLVITVLAVMLVLAIVVVRWLVVAGCFESLPKYSLPND